MTIATNDDNLPATSTLHQGIDSSTSSGTEPSANRKARRRTVQVTSKPTGNAAPPNPAPTAVRASTKTDAVLDLLRRAEGGSLSEIAAATGWQAHSVRGFLSGTVRKKLGLNLISTISGEGVRRYTIGEAAASAEPAQPIDLPPFGSFKGSAGIEQADTTQEA
jgi:hypothetical protein